MNIEPLLSRMGPDSTMLRSYLGEAGLVVHLCALSPSRERLDRLEAFLRPLSIYRRVALQKPVLEALLLDADEDRLNRYLDSLTSADPVSGREAALASAID